MPKTTILSMMHLPNGRMLVGTRDGLYAGMNEGDFEKSILILPMRIPYGGSLRSCGMTMFLWIGTNDGLFRSTDPEYERFEQVHFDRIHSKDFSDPASRQNESPIE
jgi:ligand-binding sensor domain-containing protein